MPMSQEHVDPARFSQRSLLVRTHIPARIGVDFDVGDVMDRCSGFILLLTVPLLRSHQNLPPPSCRRPFRSCSMADESRQRCRLAEECKGAIRGRIHAYASVSLTYPRRTSQPICI